MTSTPSKATAGPWAYEADETSSGPMFSVYDTFGRRVTDPHVEEQQARLIAAAPDLLAALQKIVEMNVQYAKDRYGDVTAQFGSKSDE